MNQKLDRLLSQAKIEISEQQKQQLIDFVKLLDKWNKAYNLTSVRDPEEMLVKHIMDSLVVSLHLEGNQFIDVGTGPGLPGIPLAIINPDKQFTLLDSLVKRITVLSRAEEYQEKQFDGVLSRAFASLNDMVNWCYHLPNASGRFYALKGQYQPEEVDEINQPVKQVDVIKLQVPELVGERHLVVLAKK